MIYRDIVQGSPEWKDIRLGKPSGSRVYDIVARTKKGDYTAKRQDYLLELAYETLTGEPTEFFISKDMEHGIINEPIARIEYEMKTGHFVEQVGFIDHDTIDNFGSSPDGLIGSDGSMEIKCPKSKTHLKTVLTGMFDIRYKYQMQTLLMCDNRDWCDFVSWDPRAPEYLRLYIKRFYRDEYMIAEIKREVMLFNSELKATIETLKAMKPERICPKCKTNMKEFTTKYRCRNLLCRFKIKKEGE